MNRPTMGNLFSGSGAWELAAKMCGIDVLFEAEVEPFPVALEAKRFPEAIQLGDVSKINGAEIPPVDILTNSSPCQGLSIAGMRGGLKDERSGLFAEAIRITKEMRNASRLRCGSDGYIRLYPRFWCWENVPGALSSGNPRGSDFQKVLESIVEIVQEEHPDIPVPRGGGITQVFWMAMDGRSLGESWMPNTSESLRDAEECFLSQILQGDVPQKYCLSEKACLGILRRSQVRGKTLPEVLQNALISQAGLSQETFESLKKEWMTA